MEREFLIMEVKRTGDDEEDLPENVEVTPIDSRGPAYEWANVKESRLIPESRLRYGVPESGEIYFYPPNGWEVEIATGDAICLIIDDPPPPEKSKWGEWVDKCPLVSSPEGREKLARWIEERLRIIEREYQSGAYDNDPDDPAE